MRVVIQRVKKASVSVTNEIVGEIEQGLLVFLGITHDDKSNDVDWLVQKISQLRIFPDELGKMNLSLKDTKGELLLVSQFTLFASVKKGTRPSFIDSAKPGFAEAMYKEFQQKISKELASEIPTGIFGEDMMVALENWGPVTITIDSKNRV